MKKIFGIITAIVCLCCSVTVFSEYKNPAITDNAELLTADELDELSEQLSNLRETYDCDVAVFTEYEMSGDDAESTADDIFDYMDYGAGESADGIILYISGEPRMYHMSTHGRGEYIFNDKALAYLESQILPPLKENDYYTAIKMYADGAGEILGTYESGETFGDEDYYDYYDYTGETLHSGIYVWCVIGGALLLPLLLAYILMRKKLAKMKTAVRQNYAQNYIKPNGLKMEDSRDIFLYSTVTKVERPKEEPDSGHISSSGEHHGGRGGSY